MIRSVPAMSKSRLEALVWVLIYGGLLGLSLGWFVRARSDALGWALMVVGAAVAATGATLIFVRSRMGP
jgi:hypothetical protein